MSLLDIFKNKKNISSAKDEQYKDDFILALVHRLRTPLNGARWALDAVIGDKKKDDKTFDVVNEGYNKILDAINIVNEILKVSEINSNEDFNLRKERINLCVIVESIIKNLDYLIKKNEINLEYDNKCDPITILGDKEVLDIGLTNLFDNAFRYSPKGKVIISLSKEGSMIKLSIKDGGIGIDREDLKHLFEKFFRGKNARMIDPNQSGVGLYSTKKIIEMHEGNISIDSEQNKGTTVVVRLPID